MTYEELKTEANKMGYNLTKKKEYVPHKNKCKCGGKGGAWNKMKNWEFYEEEIKAYDGRFAVVDGEVISCTNDSCPRCVFDNDDGLCWEKRLDFLYQDYKEPVVLTDDEKGTLYWYPNKPNKTDIEWIERDLEYIFIDITFPQCKFDFIKWEDDKPWEVQV